MSSIQVLQPRQRHPRLEHRLHRRRIDVVAVCEHRCRHRLRGRSGGEFVVRCLLSTPTSRKGIAEPSAEVLIEPAVDERIHRRVGVAQPYYEGEDVPIRLKL